MGINKQQSFTIQSFVQHLSYTSQAPLGRCRSELRNPAMMIAGMSLSMREIPSVMRLLG